MWRLITFPDGDGTAFLDRDLGWKVCKTQPLVFSFGYVLGLFWAQIGQEGEIKKGTVSNLLVL